MGRVRASRALAHRAWSLVVSLLCRMRHLECVRIHSDYSTYSSHPNQFTPPRCPGTGISKGLHHEPRDTRCDAPAGARPTSMRVARTATAETRATTSRAFDSRCHLRFTSPPPFVTGESAGNNHHRSPPPRRRAALSSKGTLAPPGPASASSCAALQVNSSGHAAAKRLCSRTGNARSILSAGVER